MRDKFNGELQIGSSREFVEGRTFPRGVCSANANAPMFASSEQRPTMIFLECFRSAGKERWRGFAPSFSAHVRLGEHGAPVQGWGLRVAGLGRSRGRAL